MNEARKTDSTLKFGWPGAELGSCPVQRKSIHPGLVEFSVRFAPHNTRIRVFGPQSMPPIPGLVTDTNPQGLSGGQVARLKAEFGQSSSSSAAAATGAASGSSSAATSGNQTLPLDASTGMPPISPNVPPAVSLAALPLGLLQVSLCRSQPAPRQPALPNQGRLCRS